MANFWEIRQCGREIDRFDQGGLHQCIVARRGLGQSCWAVTAFMSKIDPKHIPDCTKERIDCLSCDVFAQYDHSFLPVVELDSKT
jgi:hypothetical protein